MDTLIIAGIVVAGVVLGAWSWATLSWAGPMQPAILSMVLMALVMLVRAWLRVKAAREEGREASVGEQLKVHPAEIGVAVVGVLLCGLWSVPALRALTLPLASKQGPAVVAQALADADMDVRVRACELLFEVGGGGSDKNVIQLLETRPKEAQACLKGANKRRPGSVTLTATKSMSLWAGRMFSEQDEAKVGQACELLEPLEEMSVVAGVNMSGVLWQCAGGAQLVGVRQCCAERLAARGSLKDQLGAAEEIDAGTVALGYGTLVRRMFGTGKGQDAALVAISKKLSDEANKMWAVQVGCQMMAEEGEGLTSALEGLVVFVESDSTCRPKDKEVRLGFSSPEVWGFVCEQIIPKRLEKDAEKEVCAAIGRAQVSMAVSEAKRQVKAARMRWGMELLAQDVSSAGRRRGYGADPETWMTQEQEELAKLGNFKTRRSMYESGDVSLRRGMRDLPQGWKTEGAMRVLFSGNAEFERFAKTKEGKKMLAEKDAGTEFQNSKVKDLVNQGKFAAGTGEADSTLNHNAMAGDKGAKSAMSQYEANKPLFGGKKKR